MTSDEAAIDEGPRAMPTTSATAAARSARSVRDERINILIVDDERKNLTVLETILDDPAYRLIRAESADEALLALVSEEFALLILDIRLPGMTGFELAQIIKERKKTARVPIIFLTAYYNEDQHVLEGYGTGAVDYLQKPVNPIVLRSKVAAFADLHRKSREAVLANLALVDEISERRRAEQQLQDLNETLEQRVAERTEALRASDRRKDEFLAILAHELRNPLAPVSVAAQVLYMNATRTPEVERAKEIIDRQMRTMTRLIDDLMDVSRISRGKIELRRERFELSQIINDAVNSCRTIIEKDGHILKLSVPREPIIINADLTRLPQVFLNLLANAAKFSEKGSTIFLNVERLGDEVIVSVKDTGIGIDGDKLGSVFEMFSQIRGGALNRSHGGLGIGLYLVKSLVEMHDGQIEVKSEGLGKGSEFVVRLPIDPDQSPLRASAGNANDLAPLNSELRILVVDDNRDAALSLAMLLKATGNNVHLAHDGEEAVEAAEKHRPHVILLDIGLPKKNGYEAARDIRQHPWGQSLVLIAVTGWGQEEDRKKSESAGFNLHMVKPVDPQSLLKLLRELEKTASTTTRSSDNRGQKIH